MPKTRLKRRPETMRPATNPQPSVWDAAVRFEAWVEWRAAWVALALVLIATARIAAIYPVYSHAGDEPAHIAAGMEWLSKGQYTMSISIRRWLA